MGKHGERTGKGRYRLVLRRDPENPTDPNAIAVECWVYNPDKLYHIGWLWREDAAFIAGFVPADTPLAATLAVIDFTKGEF